MAEAKPYHSYISRKRFEEIRTELDAMGVTQKEDILAMICRVLNFDPNNRRFMEYKRQHLAKKAKETGLSLHVLNRGGAAVRGPKPL